MATRYFDYAVAESHLRESLDVLSKQRGTSDEHTQKAVRHLVELYEAWGKSEQAATYREKLASLTSAEVRLYFQGLRRTAGC